MNTLGNDKRSTLRTLLAAAPIAALGVAATSRDAEGAPKGSADLASRLDALESRHAITAVLHGYARGWDRQDEETIKDCFWPESTHQHGAFKGLSHDFVTASFKATRNVKVMSHMITNVTIELAGDKAVSESYFFAYHRRPSRTGPGDVDFFLKGRYIDKLERRGGMWKISHRRGLHDFSRTFDPADASLEAAPSEQLGQPKANDPLYTILSELKAGR